MNLRLSRRTFLGVLLAAAAAAGFGVRWWQTRQPAGPSSAMLLALLPHRESARVLGRAYLEAAPQEAGAETLRSLLADRLEPAPADGDALHRRVAECIRADFSSGEVVAVDGWLLSLTEARLCALVNLEAAA